MRTKVRGVIRTTRLASAGLGVVLSPIPFADELLLVPVYALMTGSIARAHGVPLLRAPWRRAAVAAGAGLALRAAGNLAFAFVPGVAAVSNALSAALLTEVLGRHVDGLCERASAKNASST